MSDIITDPVTGEDICISDLMIGIDTLPPRQRQAFELICLGGYTETAARDELLPNSKSSTPVQQYSDSGLVRMVDAHDLYQEGCWPPPDKPKPVPRKTQTRRSIMAAVLHPLIRKHLEDARKDIHAQIESLTQALQWVDGQLATHTNNNTPKTHQPAPNPRPEGKPDLEEMAKELASTA